MNINKNIKRSFVGILKVLFVFAMFLQIGVVIYNHLNGVEEIRSVGSFVLKVLIRTSIGFALAAVISVIFLYFIELLNRNISWYSFPLKRLMVELISVLLFSSIGVYIYNGFKINDFIINLNDIIIYNGINIIHIAVLESWLMHVKNKYSNIKTKRLKREIDRVHYELLKSQINPHFLFNCLNTLSAMITVDIEKSQKFIQEFSLIYRYILEYIEKPLSPLKKEIEFCKSYIYLQKIRYGNNIILNINISKKDMDYLVPPLSLQTLLENAFKHNIVDAKSKLSIEISVDNLWLKVSNNINKRDNYDYSTKVGHKNLVKRYLLISKLVPKFLANSNNYTVLLPLIKTL